MKPLTEEDIQVYDGEYSTFNEFIVIDPHHDGKFGTEKEDCEQLKEQILENQELADERRQQIKLENDPVIQKVTYSYDDMKRVPEWVEKADSMRYCKICHEFQNRFGFVTTKDECLSCILQQENKQLKEKLEKITNLREEILKHWMTDEDGVPDDSEMYYTVEEKLGEKQQQ